MNFKENFKKFGFVTIEQIRDGKVIKKIKFHNLITNAGISTCAKLAGLGLGGTAFSYIALGTGTTPVAAADTTLEGEITDTGMQRASATVSQQTTTVTGDTTRFYKSFSVTGVKALNKVGIFNNSFGGDMLCEALFPGVVTTANGDTIAITYDVKNA